MGYQLMAQQSDTLSSPVVFLVKFDATAFCLNSPGRSDDKDYPEDFEMRRKGPIYRQIAVCDERGRKRDSQTSCNTLDRTTDSGTVKCLEFFPGNVNLHCVGSG